MRFQLTEKNPASAQRWITCCSYSTRTMCKVDVRCSGVIGNVIRVLASRLRHLVELVEDLSFRNVNARVAKILLQHAHEATATEGHKRLTQQQMATMAGTAREMVGRALKGLEQAGAIRVERGRIVILDRKLLERLS